VSREVHERAESLAAKVLIQVRLASDPGVVCPPGLAELDVPDFASSLPEKDVNEVLAWIQDQEVAGASGEPDGVNTDG
jgi:hypothetical protein